MSRSTDKYHFFWKSKLSQWNMTSFVINDKTFSCAEQFMMWCKAMLFLDIDVAEKIMQASHPREMQTLGRQVKDYNQKVWDARKFDIVLNGNYHKFQQNPELKKLLFDTYPLTLVEASPVDKIWGIGLAEEDPLIDDEKNWQGKNLLGKALTEVRNTFMKEEGLI